MESAHKTITECIGALFHMQEKFMGLSQLESVEKGQEEDIFDLKSRVVCWLEGLFEETGHLPASAMVGRLSSYFPATRTAFGVINDCMEDLSTMESEVHQMVDSLSKGGSVHEMKRENVLRLKLSVVHQLKVFFKEIEEDEETIDEAIDDYADYEDEDEDEVSSFPVQREEPVEWWKLKDLRWSSVDEKEESNEKERYICLSNGHEIWCLDLNKSMGKPSKPPKVVTLSLLGEQLPSSVGLFKLGSNAYIIGGLELIPASVENRRGFKLYKSLLSSKGLQASSRVTHLLSLSADKEDGTVMLSHTKAPVEDLIKPKFWPIVERIGENLHVFDSNPTHPIRLNRYRSFSHEVHKIGGDGGWKEIRTIQGTEHIITHVVVGPLIYARTDETVNRPVDVDYSDEREGCRYLMFDSRNEEWKGCTVYEFFLPLEVRRVRNILTLGIARCAGEFRVRGPEPLYVLIALARDFEDKRTVAVAYLVRLTGEVVCYQRLPEYFSKAGPLQPYRMETGVMIDVDEEEVGPVRTMCSVITATIPRPDYLVEYLFINTFCVEVVRSDAVEQLLVQKASDPVELDFVRFTPKNWYIYNTDPDSISCRKFTGWRACFLTPSSP